VRNRIIDELRQRFPGAWAYDAKDNIWRGELFNVEPRSQLSPKYPDDDESCVTIYLRTDTGERLLLGSGPLF
jgi:hypothetical protein